MATNPAIPEDVAQVELAVDAAHRDSELVSYPFGEAAWHYLSFCEHALFQFLESEDVGGPADTAVFIDSLVNSMKTPLRWLRDACEPGGTIPEHYSVDICRASDEFVELAGGYNLFESLFTYARRGTIKLELHGDTLVSVPPRRGDVRYEAYDRLNISALPTMRIGAFDFLDTVFETVVVFGDRFSYLLTPETVMHGVDSLGPILHGPLGLPDSRRFTRYTLGQFKSVVSVLRTIAFIHVNMRRHAARHAGCIAHGYSSGVRVMSNEELLGRLCDCSEVDRGVVCEVVRDLTYGEREITNPDPALQPLIPLNDDSIAIVPSLILGSDFERNLIVLMNRIPEERELYSRLSNEREDLSRENIKSQLGSTGLRFKNCKITGGDKLPDIDLALIDDHEKACLILELKSFIGPAEPREVLEKAEEIAKGVNQIRRLRDAYFADAGILARPLEISESYSVTFAVASETSVGTSEVQDESIPVVLTPHLIHRLLLAGSLSEVNQWLDSRAYLPVDGQHFETREQTGNVGAWKAQWYGIKPLADGLFL